MRSSLDAISPIDLITFPKVRPVRCSTQLHLDDQQNTVPSVGRPYRVSPLAAAAPWRANFSINGGNSLREREFVMHHDSKNHWNARMAGAALAVFAILANAALAHAPRVLRVGTYHGHKGTYATIQSAVNAAAPGDWILVGPGDYHERGNPQAGVWVTTHGIHLPGLQRDPAICTCAEQRAGVLGIE
jgi:hypothetical protein